jgi:hypothetical protein
MDFGKLSCSTSSNTGSHALAKPWPQFEFVDVETNERDVEAWEDVIQTKEKRTRRQDTVLMQLTLKAQFTGREWNEWNETMRSTSCEPHTYR